MRWHPWRARVQGRPPARRWLWTAECSSCDFVLVIDRVMTGCGVARQQQHAENEALLTDLRPRPLLGGFADHVPSLKLD